VEAQLAAVPRVLLRALRSQQLALVLLQQRAQGPARQALLVQIEEQQPVPQPRAEAPPRRAQQASPQREPLVLAEERRLARRQASSAPPWPRLPSRLFPPWSLLPQPLRRRPLPGGACGLSPPPPR